MDIFNAIRALIFLTAGLILILFPKKVTKIQIKVLNYSKKRFPFKLVSSYIKLEEKKGTRSNKIIGIIFLIIAIILAIFSAANIGFNL